MEQNQVNTIKNSDELEFAIFCIENIAARLGVDTGKVYDTLAQNSDILSSYIVSGYETLHTQGKDYIVEDILSVMREDMILYHGSYLEIIYPDLSYSREKVDFGRGFYTIPLLEQVENGEGNSSEGGRTTLFPDTFLMKRLLKH